MDIKKEIGARVKELRKIKNLTQEQLAEKAGVSTKYIGDVERGKANITLDYIINLSKALNLEILDGLIKFENLGIEKQMIINLLSQADKRQLKLIYRLISSVLIE